MAKAFFPDPAFAWVFCLAIALLTGVAAWVDTRTAKIPNRLNVLTLALGLVMNAVRAAWLASQDKSLWLFDTGSPVLGVLDGLLFALLGFVVAFAFMFACWIMGLCGGGDVKLLAAVGAWTGLSVTLPAVWFASVVVLFFWFGARLLVGGITPRAVRKAAANLKKEDKAAATGAGVSRARVTYSLPICVAVVVVLLWTHKEELKLAESKPQKPQGAAHVRPSPVRS